MAAAESKAAVSVIGGLTKEKTLRPGEVHSGLIILGNADPAPQEVRVYQTDYRFFADGTNEYGEPGTVTRSNAKWITFSSARLTIPPKGTASVYYIVTVPDDPSLAGTFWSVLMVEPIPESAPENSREKRDLKVGIILALRYALQFVTHIGDTGSREIKFIEKKVIEHNGKKILQIDIENTGERSLTPSVWAELFNEDGLLVGRFESQRIRSYPGTSVRYWMDLTGLPKDRYKALVVVDSGDGYVFGGQYKLKF